MDGLSAHGARLLEASALGFTGVLCTACPSLMIAPWRVRRVGHRPRTGRGPSLKGGAVTPLTALAPCELVAREAMSLQSALLAVHRSRLPREDLEDAYAQATLELVARAKRTGAPHSAAHAQNSLRQKFESRIADRQRAQAGRSLAAHTLAHALPLDAPAVCDVSVIGDVVEQINRARDASRAAPRVLQAHRWPAQRACKPARGRNPHTGMQAAGLEHREAPQNGATSTSTATHPDQHDSPLTY
jgi:hypothetical protein